MTLSFKQPLLGVQQLKTNNLVLLREVSTNFQAFLSFYCHSNIAFQNVNKVTLFYHPTNNTEKKAVMAARMSQKVRLC